MADGVWEVVGRNSQKLPFQKTVGDALLDLVKRRHKHRARKHAEEHWGVDPKTARNFTTNGNVSERLLTKAAWSEGWHLWHALGVELFGETYADHLRGVIDDYEQARRQTAAACDQVRHLESVAAQLVAVLDRPAA